MTRVPLCTVPGCPAPNDPEWHRCFVCGKSEGDHQHFPKKSLAGKGAKIVAFLCRYHHDKIDKHQWREGVYEHPDGSVHYYVQNEKGESKCDRVIEAAPQGPDATEIDTEITGLGPWSDTDKNPDTSQEVQASQIAVAPTISTGQIGGASGEFPESPETPPGPQQPSTALSPYQDHLELGESPTWERYCMIVDALQTIEEHLNWWIGKTILDGEVAFGERAYQPWKAQGHKAEHLRQCAWVASRFPEGTRVTALSWTHHRIVSACETEKERAEWLRRADEESLGTRELQALMAGDKVECPETGGKHEWVCTCKHCGVTK